MHGVLQIRFTCCGNAGNDPFSACFAVQLRLVNGTKTSGRLIVQYSGTWGTVSKLEEKGFCLVVELMSG